MKRIIIYTISLLFTFLISCELMTNDDITTEKKVTVLEESSTSINVFKDVFNQVNSIAKYVDDTLGGTNNFRPVGKEPFPDLSIEPFDTTTWPKTIRFDYGPLNHVCSDMRERRGVIIIETTDFFRNPGCELVVSFENFYQDNYKVSGKQTIINNGFNNAGNLVYNLILEKGKISSPNNKEYTVTQDMVREWTEGYETNLNYQDDAFLISGIQNGQSSDSVSYELTINNSSPLDIMVMCRWIRAGIADISIEGKSNLSLDFGEGECDNIATVIIGGQEYIIEMN